MTLQEILNDINLPYDIVGSNGVDIKDLSLSSRDIKSGTCFFAISGEKSDGHKFINDAIESGAVCIVCEEIPESINKESASFVLVKDTSIAIGYFASSFYGHPSKKMKVIGITGTNGKTTTATMIYRALSGFMRKTGLISTVENIIGNEIIESTHTTPDAITLQKLLNQMVKSGCEYVVMEVSSHSIVQHRINGINFTGAVFTNLSHDHLDYHHTIDNYAKAKKMFFDNLPINCFAITNVDDVYGKMMVADCKAHIYTYGFNSNTDFSELVTSKLIGHFNEYNMLAVFCVLKLLGFETNNIKNIIKDLPGPKGRFELVYNQAGIRCIVDYAHTPDGIQNVLESARNLITDNGRIITVFGCGGDRDSSKRPIMGRLAYDLSDIIIITSDNPRSEDPQKIINEIKQGLPETESNIIDKEMKQIEFIIDREQAIKKSISLAKPGDIVMVLGKGHETYQEIAGVKNHFDDKAIVLSAFGV
jgi:UDP-N-acetylmuramoyl-L-alanyl-D-glutamate--2,6-diaminopimelate ligase